MRKAELKEKEQQVWEAKQPTSNTSIIITNLDKVYIKHLDKSGIHYYPFIGIDEAVVIMQKLPGNFSWTTIEGFKEKEFLKQIFSLLKYKNRIS